LAEFGGKHMWVPADVEGPGPGLTPGIDGADPAAGRFVFGAVFVRFVALDLKDERRAVGQADEEIGFVTVGASGKS
jgi:hypothetical protein